MAASILETQFDQRHMFFLGLTLESGDSYVSIIFVSNATVAMRVRSNPISRPYTTRLAKFTIISFCSWTDPERSRINVTSNCRVHPDNNKKTKHEGRIRFSCTLDDRSSEIPTRTEYR